MKRQTDEIAISVKNVQKNFHLPHEKANSMKSSLVHLFTRDKGYDIQHALKDISFDVKKGEFFGILGRNGSGKSTLLKILAEIYQPTSGSVEHHGKLVPFIELGVGFNPELSGRENVYLNGALLGFSVKEIDEKYDEIVKFAELEEFMDQKLKNYSSGMQVRLAFSVATRAEADILLVDEVLAVGDADFQRKCYDFFKALKKSGKTIIFVTHDMGAVKEYCDRAILVSEGLIAHQGSADDIADEYLKLFNTANAGLEDTSKAENHRWGNRDIVIEKVSHSLTKDTLRVMLTLKNNTAINFENAVDLGLDFYIDDKVITGTHYLYYHTHGFSIGANGKKNMIVEFPNVFGGHTYDVLLNVKTNNGTNVCDHWKKAFSFTNIFQPDRYFKVIAKPTVFE